MFQATAESVLATHWMLAIYLDILQLLLYTVLLQQF